MNPCKLRHSITIQERTETRNSTGEVEWTWSTFWTGRAAVEPLRGQELFGAQQVQSKLDTRICTWYIAGVTTKMRVVFEGRYFGIEAVIDPEMRHRELQLMCVERSAEGWRD